MCLRIKNLTWIFCACFSMVWIGGCEEEEPNLAEGGTETYTVQVATDWMELLLTLTKENQGFTPPVAARAMGYTGLTLYESVRPGMKGYKSMAGQVNQLAPGMIPEPVAGENYHWGLVANAALAAIIKACYANASIKNLNRIDSLETYFADEVFNIDLDPEVFDRSVKQGKAVGAAMVAYALSDNQSECYNSNFPSNYVPPVGEGLWKPTPPAFQKALQPYWGNVRPFVSKNIKDALPAAPPAFSKDPNSKFWKELVEVHTTVKQLSPDQRSIAEYWSDDPGKTATPPGHSLSILIQILENQKDGNLALAAESFAKLGMGLHDAFISCWYAKYTYNLVRPITLIHQYIEPGFSLPLATPPFPEYTSGHSVQSGAAAQILTDIFGEKYTFTDRTHEKRTDINGTPRSFSSFYAFADEAAISRLYGGIHYRTAIEVGVEQGKVIGKNISALPFK